MKKNFIPRLLLYGFLSLPCPLVAQNEGYDSRLHTLNKAEAYEAATLDFKIRRRFEALEKYPLSARDSVDMSRLFNSAGWNEMLSGSFLTAEKMFLMAQEYDPGNPYPNTNLPAVWLFLGKTEEALAAYERWCLQPFPVAPYNQSYADIFLEDLQVFESKGMVTQNNQARIAQARAQVNACKR